MAGDAAGQITASLTLDISKFQESIKKAQSAIGKMQKTIDQAASSGGGGDASAQSSKKAASAAKKQKEALSNLVLEYKNLRHNFKQGAQSQEAYKKSMQGVVQSANTLKAAVDANSVAYEKFNNVAGMAASQIAKVESAEKKAAMAAKKTQLAMEEKTRPEGRRRGGKDNTKAMAEVRKNISSLSDQLKSNQITAADAKKSLEKYEASLKRLGAGLTSGTAAFRELNKGLAASTGMKAFINVSDTAASKMSNLTSQVDKGASKMSTVFAAMSTGGAGAARATVMSFTNITEAFQKGLMGGRQFAMFFMGDLSDAMMIGSFHASGFAKAAAAAAGSTKALLLNMAKWVIPFQMALTGLMGVLGLVAAKMGWFGAKTKDAKKEARELSGEISDLEFFLRNAGSAQRALNEAFQDFNADDAKDEIAAVKKQISQLPKLGTAVSRLKREIDDQNSSLSQAGKEIKNANRDFAKYLKIEEDLAKKTSDLNKERNTELGILESLKQARRDIYDPTVIRSEAQKKAMTEAVNKEIDLQKMKILNVENAISRTGAAARLLKGYIEGQRDALKDIVDLAPKVKEAAPKTTKKGKPEKEEEDPALKFFTDAMKEAIGQAKNLQEIINSLYEVIKEAPTGEQAGLLKSLGVKDAEAQLKKIEKRMADLKSKAFWVDPETGVILRDMEAAAAEQEKMKQDARVQAEYLKEAARAIALAQAASAVGRDVSAGEIMEMGPAKKARLSEITEQRTTAAKGMGPMLGGVDVAKKVFKNLEKGLDEVDGFGSRLQTAGLQVEKFGLAGMDASKFGKLLQKTGKNIDKVFDGVRDDLVMLGAAAVTAAASMVDAFAGAVSGDFGSVMSTIGGGVGAGVAVAAGAPPEMGQKIGSAIGAFSDMMISNMTVQTDVLNADGEFVELNMGELINWEFMDQLKVAMDAFQPLAEIVFFLASNLGGLLAAVVNMLTPVLEGIAGTLGHVFKLVFDVFAVILPLIAIVGGMIGLALQVINPFLDIVIQIIDIFMPLVAAITTLIHVFWQLDPIIALIMLGLEKLAYVMNIAAEFIAEPLDDAAKAVISFVDAIGHAIVWLGETLFDWQWLKDVGAALIASAAALEQSATTDFGAFGRDVEESAKAMAEETNQRQKATEAAKNQAEASKALNVPKGFKVEKYRYEAMNPEQSNPFTGSRLDGSMTINIENIFVEDGEDLLDQLNEANETGGLPPTGGF
tara:strand:- start:25062 stop:28697 length:3636 start_codon:yes stop_codon:yes gene_type:complete